MPDGNNSGSNRPKIGTQGSSHGQPAHFQAGWKRDRRKLVALRESLFRRRLTLKEKRNEIREERLYLDGLENELLGSISRYLNLGEALEQSLIQDLHTEILSKKDEIGSLQYDYDQAEEDYDAAEAGLVEHEDIENENIDDYDVADQSSDVEVEDPASDQVHLHSNNLEKLHRQHSRQPLSASQDIQRHCNASGIDESNQNSKSEAIPSQEVEAQGKAEKKDSVYDKVEATFKTRAATRPVGQTNHDIPFGGTSRKSKQKDGEVYIGNRSRLLESMSHTGSITQDGSAPRETQYLDPGSKTRSDSEVTTRRKVLIRRRSRVIWWLFNTFGSSGVVDYLERTRDRQQLSSSKQDDETWACHVFGHWTQKRIPAAVSVTPGATSSTEFHRATHVEEQSLGGSYLLLPSGISKLEHSVEDVDRLFANTRVLPQGLVQSRDKDLDDELSTLIDDSRSLQSQSFPHLRRVPTQPNLDLRTSPIQLSA